MKLLLNSLPSYFTFAVFHFATTGKCELTKQNGDYQYEQFLNETMGNYSTWLRKNKLDPSPPSAIISKIKSSIHEPLILLCDLSNHHAVGHSSPHKDLGFSSSYFDSQSFRIGRTSNVSFAIYGNFSCTGVIQAVNFKELENDLAFSGKGNFEIEIKSYSESLTMRNVRVVNNYTLDLAYSSAFYRLNPDLDQFSTRMEGVWNETLITGKYFDEVQNIFRKSFWEFAVWRFDNDPGTSLPSGQLLERYARETAEGAHLTDIIKNEDLPEPYSTRTRSTCSGGGDTVFAESHLLVQALALLSLLYFM